MRVKSGLVLLLAAVGCVATLVWLLPLTARAPFVTPPNLFARMNPQHGYEAPGIMEFTPVLVGVAVVGVFTWLYFWITEKLER